MKEEKRKILTKEGVRRQQLRHMKGELMVVVPVILFFEAMMIAFTYGAYRLSPRMWMIWGSLALLDLLILALFVWKFILPGVRGLRYISSGNFSIVEDKLVGVGEDEVMRSRGKNRHYTIDMLYFENYGTIPEDKGTRGYGPCGSMFYLVVLNDPNHTIHTFYSSQLYYYDHTKS
jgi:hypothetical protein